MTVIGVDVGGTKILGAAFDGDLEVARVEVPTPRADDGRGDPGGDATIGVIDQLASGRSISSVCIAVPEYVRDGVVTSEEVLAWPPSTTATIERKIEAQVSWESDVRCGAIGEWQALAPHEDGDGGQDGATRTLLFVSLGTGVSHTLVADGSAFPGERGEAIALGELRRDRDGPTVERFSSGRAMVERWTAIHGAIQPADLFSPSDATGRAFLDEPAELLGWAIAQAALLLDPGRVVLGGGLGSRDTQYRHLIIEAAARYSTRHPITIYPSIAGSDAGLRGAAHLARTAARR